MQQSAPSVEDIFFAALELESPAARSAFLDRACGTTELRRRVERLLAHDAQANDFLEAPAPSPTMTAPHDSRLSVEEPGTTIGPYRLLEAIGEGGMGVVYVAEQAEPVRRRVALKLIKPGMDSRQVVARFEAERQALAMMEHPNIAKVHDAGMTSAGRPYFVMELVRGLPITDFCDQHEFTVPERLELFTLVCRAVQHAHQKGIIHRDLKPSNVLVTEIDGVAVPKVIDFGVAKATGGALTDKTVYTGFHQFVGTPLYTSPEQADLAGTDVDTRSDIYSLGVLLYELLTGTTPFDSETLKRAAFDEMRRIIREEEPPRPSTRLSSLGERLSTVSARRKADPRRLGATVKGELDWVVMRALEKDRRRRYETAGDFAADVMRYLTDRPVEAHPPTARYRLGKFARRNRVPLGFAALGAAGLALAVTGLAAGLVRISREQAVSRERLVLARQAVDEMYTEVAEDWLAQRERMTPLQRQFLEKALAFYTRFAAEPVADPEDRHKAAMALSRVAAIRRALGNSDQGRRDSEQAAARLTTLAQEFPARAAYRQGLTEALSDLAEYYEEAGRLAEAEATLLRALPIEEGLRNIGDHHAGPEDQNRLFWLHYQLANLYLTKAHPRTARNHMERALGAAEQRLKQAPGSQAARHEMALALIQRKPFVEELDGRIEDAEESTRRAIALSESLVSEHPTHAEYRATLALACNSLGGLLANWGPVHRRAERFEEARAAFARGDAVLEQLVASYPQMVRYRGFRRTTLNNLAYALQRAGRLDDAIEAYRRCIEMTEGLVAAEPGVLDHRVGLAATLENLASIHQGRGEWDAALPLLDGAASHMDHALKHSDRNPRYGDQLQGLLRARAEVHLRLGDHAAAAVDARRMDSDGIPDPNRARSAFNAYLTLRDCVSAVRRDPRVSPDRRGELVEDYLVRARKVLDEVEPHLVSVEPWGKKHWVGEVAARLVADLALGDVAELRDPARAVRMAQSFLERHADSPDLWRALGLARACAGDPDGAIGTVEKSLAIRGATAGSYEHAILAIAHARKGDLPRAREAAGKVGDQGVSAVPGGMPGPLLDELASLSDGAKPRQEADPPWHGVAPEPH